MTDETSYMFVTGPKVVKTVTGEDISTEDLGGAGIHSSKSGVAHFKVENEEEGILIIRKLLSYLPSNNLEDCLLYTSSLIVKYDKTSKIGIIVLSRKLA